MINHKVSTPCAFHSGNVIEYFCKNINCLLPLCVQCISIHKQQHNKLQTIQKIESINIIINELKDTIQKQDQSIIEIHKKMTKKWQMSQQQHQSIRNNVLMSRDNLTQNLNKVYNKIIQDIDNNREKRQYWIRQFTLSINNVRTQLQGSNIIIIGIHHSLNGQKYLRALIMWNQINPNQAIQEMIRLQNSRQWTNATYQNCNTINLVNTLSDSIKLSLLELESQFGTRKIIKTLRLLRYGEDRQGGITITDKSVKQSLNNNQFYQSNTSQFSTPQQFISTKSNIMNSKKVDNGYR